MIKRNLNFWVFFTIFIYAACIFIGVILKTQFPENDDPVYSAYKDFIPLFIAIPAAWLGYCFSRRLAYLQQLRGLWSEVNSAVQSCIQYTYLLKPSKEEYSSILHQTSIIIDEIRGAFKNLGEAPGDRGLYPFEEIKEIREQIYHLGFGDKFDYNKAIQARRLIIEKWKKVQEPFLSEFDREEPTYYSSPYMR